MRHKEEQRRDIVTKYCAKDHGSSGPVISQLNNVINYKKIEQLMLHCQISNAK